MIVLACEGKSEVLLLQRLLSEGWLCFSKKDVLDHKPLHLRQLRTYAALLNTVPFETHLEIYRIGDTLKDELDLSLIQSRVSSGYVEVRRYCTKPEIEILSIIYHGWAGEFQKSKLMPKEFISQFHSKEGGDFIKEAPIEDIVSSLREYRRIKKHDKGERYLAELLR